MSTIIDDEEQAEFTYDQLSERAKQNAREKWREQHPYPDDIDVDQITEMLAEDLKYEFGIEVRQRTYKTTGGKTGSSPCVYWETYPTQVKFENDNLDLEQIIAHGVEGCECYSAEADAVRKCWEAIQVFETFLLECEQDWTFALNDGLVSVDYRYDAGLNVDQKLAYGRLAQDLEDSLTDLYKAACSRLEKLFDSDIDWHYSDECIEEDIEANYLTLFDEDGDLL